MLAPAIFVRMSSGRLFIPVRPGDDRSSGKTGAVCQWEGPMRRLRMVALVGLVTGLFLCVPDVPEAQAARGAKAQAKALVKRKGRLGAWLLVLGLVRSAP